MRKKVSLVIISYNEEKNLSFLLKSLKKQLKYVDSVFLISDGSTDNTNNIINQFNSKSSKIYKFINSIRKGKRFRIDKVMKKIKSDIIILGNGDILIQKNTIKKIISKFEDNNLCLLTTKAIPLNKQNNIMGKLAQVYWDLHHELSLIKPKGSELIAFKNIKLKLKSSVDEVDIISNFQHKKDLVKYFPNIIFYNKGPNKLCELISQIKRNHNGHLFLFKRTGYKDITLDIVECFRVLIKYLIRKPTNFFLLFLIIIIQIIGRSLGFFNYLIKKETIIWKITKTTKKLK